MPPSWTMEGQQAAQPALPGPPGAPQGGMPPLGAVVPPPQTAPGLTPQGAGGMFSNLPMMQQLLGMKALAEGETGTALRAFTPRKSIERRVLTGAGGFKRYTDTQERVFPQAQLKPPEGFSRTAEGLAPIPGGARDPAYLAGVEKAKTPQYSGKVFLDKQVGKYYQRNPKTNKREYISPNEEWALESDGSGGFRFTKGAKTPGGMTRTTRVDIEKRLLAANENYVRLQNMAATFKPEYQETGFRIEELMTTWQAKLRGAKSVSPEDTRRHVKYIAHRREAFSNLNQYIKDITGAQMSEFEARRLRKAVPDPGDSVLGGDDPIAYQAKMASALNDFAKAKARYEFYLEKGLSEGRSYDVDEMSKLTPLDSMRIAVEDKTGNRVVIFQGNALPI